MKKFSLLGLAVSLFAIGVIAQDIAKRGRGEVVSFDDYSFCSQMCSEGIQSPSMEDLDKCLAACLASFK